MSSRSTLADFDVVAGPAPSRPRPPVVTTRAAEPARADRDAPPAGQRAAPEPQGPAQQ